MSKRNDRREAERLARRAAYLQSRKTSVAAEPTTDQITESVESLGDYVSQLKNALSEVQLAANQANAQLSTGPVTEAGKAISSQNALKHGLSGKTVLLPTDDAAEYEKLLNLYTKRHAPIGDEEQALVQSLLDCNWRIARIKNLETGIMLKGQIEFAKLHADQPAAQRAQLIQVETYLKYEKSLRNLNIQESRLYRRMEKDQAELTRLQTARKRQAAEDARQAEARRTATVTPSNGFVFSSAEHNPQTTPKSTSRSQQAAAR